MCLWGNLSDRPLYSHYYSATEKALHSSLVGMLGKSCMFGKSPSMFSCPVILTTPVEAGSVNKGPTPVAARS